MTDQQYYDVADEEFLKSMLKQRRSFECGVGPITEGPPTIAQNLDLYQVPVVNNPCIIPSTIMAINSTERDKKKFPNPNRYFIKLPSTLKVVKQVELIGLEFNNGMYNVDSSNDTFQFSESRNNDTTGAAAQSSLVTFTVKIAHGDYALVNDLISEVVNKMNNATESIGGDIVAGPAYTVTQNVNGVKPSNVYVFTPVSGISHRLSIGTRAANCMWHLPLGNQRQLRLADIKRVPATNRIVITFAEEHGLAPGAVIYLRNVVDPQLASVAPVPPTTFFQTAWDALYNNGYPLPYAADNPPSTSTIVSKTQIEITTDPTIIGFLVGAWTAAPTAWRTPLQGYVDYKNDNSIAQLLGFGSTNYATHPDLSTTLPGAWTEQNELATMRRLITKQVTIDGLGSATVVCRNPHHLRNGDTIYLRSENSNLDGKFGITPRVVSSAVQPTIFQCNAVAGLFNSSAEGFVYYGEAALGAAVARTIRMNAPARYDLSRPHYIYMKLTPMADDSLTSTHSLKDGTTVESWHGNFYFCKLQLDAGKSAVTFQQGNHKGQLKRWGAPVAKISSLYVEFYYPSGELADLQGLDHSFTLEWLIGK